MDFSDYLNTSLLFLMFYVMYGVLLERRIPLNAREELRAMNKTFIVSIGGERIARKQFHNN